jgi:hypothetical protein
LKLNYSIAITIFFAGAMLTATGFIMRQPHDNRPFDKPTEFDSIGTGLFLLGFAICLVSFGVYQVAKKNENQSDNYSTYETH